MKKFLIISGSLLAFALVVVVLVFLFVVTSLPAADTSTPEPESPVSVEGNSADKTADKAVPAEGIPLKSLPLAEGQKSALETVGVDVETFVITPAMQACAAEKLGAERMNEIVAGATPGFIETAKLLPCTRAE